MLATDKIHLHEHSVCRIVDLGAIWGHLVKHQYDAKGSSPNYSKSLPTCYYRQGWLILNEFSINHHFSVTMSQLMIKVSCIKYHLKKRRFWYHLDTFWYAAAWSQVTFTKPSQTTSNMSLILENVSKFLIANSSSIINFHLMLTLKLTNKFKERWQSFSEINHFCTTWDPLEMKRKLAKLFKALLTCLLLDTCLVDCD